VGHAKNAGKFASEQHFYTNDAFKFASKFASKKHGDTKNAYNFACQNRVKRQLATRKLSGEKFGIGKCDNK
jgi:hypothetical protein